MFDSKFQFGVATSSYQIEGTQVSGTEIDSIWDSFAKKKNTISDGSNGSIACEHVTKYKEDIALMKELGVDTYRFSVSWARVMPSEGIISSEGLKFYKDILLELKRNNIKASVTTYHWDMPQWIYEKNGGWISRDTSHLYLEYARILFDNFDEYVDSWVTFNEPFCSAYLGYLTGVHAPGHKDSREYFIAAHNINLAHGLALWYYRTKYKKPIGIVINVATAYAIDNEYNNQIAKAMEDAAINKMHLDPIFKGSYPMEHIISFLPEVNDFGFIKSEDLELASQPIDFLGINYYTRTIVAYDNNSDNSIKHVETDTIKTAMGWDVAPKGLYDIIHRIRTDYTNIPIIITENGSAWDDELEGDTVNDANRIDYLEKHLKVVEKLNNENMNIIGYYVWSLMDNFEWSNGYEKRFGLVYVDYKTQKRYPKNSFYRYKQIIEDRLL